MCWLLNMKIYILHNRENLRQNTKSKFLFWRLSGWRTIQNWTVFRVATFIIHDDMDNVGYYYCVCFIRATLHNILPRNGKIIFIIFGSNGTNIKALTVIIPINILTVSTSHHISLPPGWYLLISPHINNSSTLNC